jgi:hypothetical protein
MVEGVHGSHLNHLGQQAEINRIKCVLSSVYKDVHGQSLTDLPIFHARPGESVTCSAHCARIQIDINHIKCIVSELYEDVRRLKARFLHEDRAGNKLDLFGFEESPKKNPSSVGTTPSTQLADDDDWTKEDRSIHTSDAQMKQHGLKNLAQGYTSCNPSPEGKGKANAPTRSRSLHTFQYLAFCAALLLLAALFYPTAITRRWAPGWSPEVRAVHFFLSFGFRMAAVATHSRV